MGDDDSAAAAMVELCQTLSGNAAMKEVRFGGLKIDSPSIVQIVQMCRGFDSCTRTPEFK